MRLDWLEDFLALTQAGTFSKAARLRNVTQPAFSRRIQMLERWLDVELVDRRSRRLELTATARRYEPELRRAVERVYELRSHMRADSLVHTRVSLTTQHTLMVSHLPALLHFFHERQPDTAFRVLTGNRDECMAQVTRGDADLLMCFEAQGEALPERAAEMERLEIGRERLMPVTAAALGGTGLADPEGARAISLLNYPEESFLGRVVRSQCLPELVKDYTVDTICESAFAVGLKEMVLAGMGVAWLPSGLIERELEAGLVRTLPRTLASPVLTIAVYRLRNSTYPALDDIWSLLERETPLAS